jgi:hypothetical protein
LAVVVVGMVVVVGNVVVDVVDVVVMVGGTLVVVAVPADVTHPARRRRRMAAGPRRIRADANDWPRQCGLASRPGG